MVSSPPSSETDEEWKALLAWLATFPGHQDPEKDVKLVHNAAGRGLVARGDVPPNTTLISIPNAALLNLRTLRPLYPKPFHTLTATQFLSLHLALQFRRHLSPSASSRAAGKAPADRYWPFLATLPRRFPTVPLWWSVYSRTAATLRADFDAETTDESLDELEKAEKGAREARGRRRFAELLGVMPAGVRRRTEEIADKFKADWAAARKVWTSQHDVSGAWGLLDFLLGWLNVNTRCIWFSVDSSKDNNLTLCPVIDMINHVPGRATKPHPELAALTFHAPTSSSGDPPLRDGDELAFSYGAHEDSMLCAEYGFVVGRDNEYNAVEIDRFVEALFDAQEGGEGEVKKGVLRDEGYWGDMTLQSGTDTPHASWRVLVALRLLHHRLPSHASSPSASSAALLSADALAPWYHVLTGAAERISPANEKKVAATLKGVCDAVRREAAEGGKRCDAIQLRWDKEPRSVKAVEGAEEADRDDEEARASLDMLRTIWREEERIAGAVAEAQ
ncbi:hypothetical protein Rhopal_001631-T1 [Rhodotorula paludigena]|uniref:SET domain-containing protein n=1 Tax=Rhodotorula paludigena TaxID=86838 RepID=A0AAV5GGH3_9BASI|nr:hypothetical protein Rhopal_001631-T1 [Rhodotorula paludigena]